MITKEQALKIKNSVLNDEDRLHSLFRALGDPNRYYIFRLLLQKPEICVSDIAGVLQVSVPAVSQQMRILEMTGLVHKERMGQTICYCVKREDPLVKSIIKLLDANPKGKKK